MKVKELIEKLKTFDENLDVVGQWRDVEYGLDITEHIDLYVGTVKKIEGMNDYHKYDVLVYGKQLASTDVEVLVIDI
jgi:hypothetical protein